MGYAARSVVDKAFAVLLPVAAFVALGFEHCVANMFFLPLGWLLVQAGVSVDGMAVETINLAGILKNLSAATLGNIVAGASLALVYRAAYGKKTLSPWIAMMAASSRLKMGPPGLRAFRQEVSGGFLFTFFFRHRHMRSTNPGFCARQPLHRELSAPWLEFFEKFPRAELHCHLLGTISRETFMDLVRESEAPVTEEEVNEFFTRGEKPVGVLRIFRALEEHILKKPEMLRRITVEHMASAREHGVRYIEFFWNWTGLKRHFSYEAGQRAIIEGLREGEARFGIVGRLIPSIDREASPEDALEL